MPTQDQDAYVAEVFGTDPAGYPTMAGQAGAPPGAQPPVPIAIGHLCEATSPANRKRTRIGVGERVTPGPGKWTVSGGVLSSRDPASTITLIALDQAGNLDVAVDVGGQKLGLRFTVVAPDSLHMDVVDTRHDANGRPNGGIHTNVFVGPADVSFANIKLLEKEIGCSAHGYWAAANGQGHGPYPTPVGMLSLVVPGKGTKFKFMDNCAIWGGPANPPWNGDCVFQIPWEYCVGTGGMHQFTVATQSMTSDAAGTLTVSKAGASHAFKLTDGASTYAGAPY